MGGEAFGHDTIFGEGQGQRGGEPYRVVVSFVNPEIDKATEPDHDRFWASFGAWQDDLPIGDILRDI